MVDKVKEHCPKKITKCRYCELTAVNWQHYLNCDHFPNKVKEMKNELQHQINSNEGNMSIYEVLRD